MMAVRVKRIYDPYDKADGIRVLVDRLWPRGISKDKAFVDEWFKEVAPSDKLRKWFGHEPARWKEFRRRYRKELQSPEQQALIRKLRAIARRNTVTILFAARDEEHNNARILGEILRGK